MKKPFLIRLLVADKTIATIYPTPEYAGRHLVADVAQFALTHGKPVKVEFGEAHSIRFRREDLN
jgi:hypothetical protein